MKLHRNIALGIVAGLESSLFEKRPAAEVIKKLLKSNRGWGSRDRRIIAQVFYDVIRQKRLFQALTGTENSNKDLWSLVACWMVLNNFTLPDWEEFKAVNTDSVKFKVSILNATNEIQILHSRLVG